MWAGTIEREGERGFQDNEGNTAKDWAGNPFMMLERRAGFVDVREERRAFGEWVRSGAEGEGIAGKDVKRD